MKASDYLKWWRRHFTPRFPKEKVLERLCAKLWIHFANINTPSERRAVCSKHLDFIMDKL